MLKFIMPLAVASLLAPLCGCRPTDSYREHFSKENADRQFRNAQESECSYGTFKPRPFPLGIIELEARYLTKDPNNTVVGSVYAKCSPDDINKYIVCGVAARRNRVGYIDNALAFFGRYANASFEIEAVGNKALKICQANGL
jgi:hypothetical protein